MGKWADQISGSNHVLLVYMVVCPGNQDVFEWRSFLLLFPGPGLSTAMYSHS